MISQHLIVMNDQNTFRGEKVATAIMKPKNKGAGRHYDNGV